MTLYFGRLGSLVALPTPRVGMEGTWDRVSTTQRTIGGGQVVNFSPGGRRMFRPQWTVLDRATYAVLEEFYTGMRGTGPWVLLDSTRRNHLAANQASATAVDNDPAGFTVDSSERLTSTGDAYLRGPRCLKWTLPATVSAGVLEVDPPSGLVGVPTPAGQSWTWSGSLSCLGLAPSVTVTPVLSWRRVDGSEVSPSSGTLVAAVVGSWAAFSVTATPPAGAAALRAQLRVTPAVLVSSAIMTNTSVVTPISIARSATAMTINAMRHEVVALGRRKTIPATVTVLRTPLTNTDVLLDKPQLEMGASASAWTPGTGVPLCSWTSLSDVHAWADNRAPVEATWVEVG